MSWIPGWYVRQPSWMCCFVVACYSNIRGQATACLSLPSSLLMETIHRGCSRRQAHQLMPPCLPLQADMPTISAQSPTSAQHLAMEQDLSEVFGVHPSTEGERFDHADADLPFDLDDAEVERLRAATQSAAR